MFIFDNLTKLLFKYKSVLFVSNLISLFGRSNIKVTSSSSAFNLGSILINLSFIN